MRANQVAAKRIFQKMALASCAGLLLASSPCVQPGSSAEAGKDRSLAQAQVKEGIQNPVREKSAPSFEAILLKQEKLSDDLARIQGQLSKMSEVQEKIADLVWRAESRTGTIKGTGGLLLLYSRIFVVAFLGISAIFAVILIWYFRRKLKVLSGFAEDVAGSLVGVQERQVILAARLKELEEELQYVPATSMGEFRKLWDEASLSLKEAEERIDAINSRLKSP